jgi:acyl dehydratase
MTTFTLATPEQAAAHAGQEVACSDWLLIDQARVDAFADATGDRQWIHVDTARAARESPFGGTIAHGFLTLSLIAGFFQECVAVDGVRHAVNYGLDRVRFVAPVRVGTRIRARFFLATVTPVPGGWQLAWRVTIEVEGEARPACVAEMLLRWYV